uniref:15-oxoprostaglandin 13-reductase n=1 Tax=Megaselia scalaris TaxID=36166 RepID=T1GVK8_MEGSC
MEESKVGSVILGDQIARVLKSANYKYPEGSIVFGKFGWTTHTILKPHDEGWNHQNPLHSIYLLPDLKKKPISYALGVLGIPGNTAYFGLLDILKPKPRETVAVSAAAGCVGSLVGQIAKIKECKVVGFTSSQEKCEYLVRVLGFDYAFNYNSSDLSQQLKTTLPNGIDCYFDSVGGKLTNTILEHMNHFGRIAVGGCISLYNNCAESAIAPITHPKLLSKELKVEGFNVHRWNKSWADGIQQNLDWLREGKLIYNETISLGFENIPKAFIDMMNDENIGESIVKV